jgi:hypothetical protein
MGGRFVYRFSLLLLMAAIACGSAALMSVSASARDLPIAAYSFDEGEGSTAEDAAGEHDGTIEGPGWSKGKFGKSLEFDGEAGDLVTIPGTEDLQLEEFTIEAWVRPDKCGLLEPVVAKLSDEDFGYALYAGGDSNAGRPEGYILDGKEIDSHAVDDASLSLHAWSHIAVTNDGNKIRLYVNGELVDTGWSSDVKAGGEGPLTIGGNEGFEEGEYFSGKIDEVRVYDRALDGQEVAIDKGAPIQTPRTGPIAAYSFDEGEGSTAEDSAGEHDGTVEGPGWSKGRFGKALEFDGEAGDLVTIPGTEDLQLEEFTIEAWVRPAQSDLLAPVVARLDEEDFGYALYAGGDGAAGRPEGYVLEGKQIDSYAVDDEALPERAWSHIAVTNDGAHLRLYVNGELVDSRPASDVKAGGEGPLTIGGNEAFGEGEYFSGKIDEVRIYERALDGGEVAADKGAPIQTPATGPIAAYSFDEGEGSTAEDAAGEHDGTIEGPGWSKGKFGKSLEFDGEAGDLVTIPGTEDLQLEEFTIEAWVRPDKCGLLEPVVAKLSDEDFGYALYAGGDSNAGRPEGYILDGKEIDSHAVDDASLSLHAWSHIAVTNDGNKIRLYVNGELVDTGWSSDVKAGGEGPLTIGGNEGFEEGEYFSGKIDEVRVYDRALGNNEMSDILPPRFREKFEANVAFNQQAEEQGIYFTPATDPPLANGSLGSGVSRYRYRYSVNSEPFGPWQLSGMPYFSTLGLELGDEVKVQVYAIDAVDNQGEMSMAVTSVPMLEEEEPEVEGGPSVSVISGPLPPGYRDGEEASISSGSVPPAVNAELTKELAHKDCAAYQTVPDRRKNHGILFEVASLYLRCKKSGFTLTAARANTYLRSKHGSSPVIAELRDAGRWTIKGPAWNTQGPFSVSAPCRSKKATDWIAEDRIVFSFIDEKGRPFVVERGYSTPTVIDSCE